MADDSREHFWFLSCAANYSHDREHNGSGAVLRASVMTASEAREPEPRAQLTSRAASEASEKCNAIDPLTP